MPLERDCRKIVLYSVLKSVRRDFSDGSALDQLPMVLFRLNTVHQTTHLFMDILTFVFLSFFHSNFAGCLFP